MGLLDKYRINSWAEYINAPNIIHQQEYKYIVQQQDTLHSNQTHSTVRYSLISVEVLGPAELDAVVALVADELEVVRALGRVDGTHKPAQTTEKERGLEVE